MAPLLSDSYSYSVNGVEHFATANLSQVNIIFHFVLFFKAHYNYSFTLMNWFHVL